MLKIIQFILSFFGAGTKQKILDAIKDKLLRPSGGGASDGGGPLGGLMKQFQEKGLGDIFKSWVGTGANHAISPEQVQNGIGPDKMQELAQKTGLPIPELAKQLAKHLPGLVDRMTPAGKLPDA